MISCRVCGNPSVRKVLSLGNMPLANGFLKDPHEEEPRFPLELAFCPRCTMVQLTEVVPPDLMFRHYVYVTSTTKTFQSHFWKLAEDVTQDFRLGKGSTAVDIGSNDGLLLSGFRTLGLDVIGIEPARNIAELAEKNGIETVNGFFGKISAEEVLRRKGKADVVTATNVFAHVHDLRLFVECVKMLLSEKGVFIIEVQYLGDMLEKLTFDNIYHEHLSYFSLTALRRLFSLHGMQVFRAQRVESHGGSIRVYVQMGGAWKHDGSVNRLLEYERSLGIADAATYERFASRVHATKTRLLLELQRFVGKQICGYGAPAKASTLLNFCGIGLETLECVFEDNPLKVGLYMPGTHIPIVSTGELPVRQPDYVLVLAWNFAEEILAKSVELRKAGTRFIVPLPELRVF